VKIRDRWAASAGERIRFTSAILPLVGAADEELGRTAACALPAGHHYPQSVCNPAYIDHVHPRRSSPSRTAERPVPC